jgi:hypothetical protein
MAGQAGNFGRQLQGGRPRNWGRVPGPAAEAGDALFGVATTLVRRT